MAKQEVVSVFNDAVVFRTRSKVAKRVQAHNPNSGTLLPPLAKELPRDELMARIECLENELATRDDLLTRIECLENSLAESTSQNKEKIDKMRKDIDKLLSKSDNSNVVQDRAVADLNLTLSQNTMRLNLLECKSVDGSMVWKITGVKTRSKDARSGKQPSIYSQPFYTSPTGYKMCLRLYLNGDGMGRGTHISIFFVVMRGEYDALLEWPFQNKVTLMLLNQRDHMVKSADTFAPDPSSSSFRRPISEMNIASGCPLFMSLEEFDRLGFVQDDCLFVKIIISAVSRYGPACM